MVTSSLLFGWCIKSMPDHQHKQCKQEFWFDGKQVVCQCECHKEK